MDPLTIPEWSPLFDTVPFLTSPCPRTMFSHHARRQDAEATSVSEACRCRTAWTATAESGRVRPRAGRRLHDLIASAWIVAWGPGRSTGLSPTRRCPATRRRRFSGSGFRLRDRVSTNDPAQRHRGASAELRPAIGSRSAASASRSPSRASASPRLRAEVVGRRRAEASACVPSSRARRAGVVSSMGREIGQEGWVSFSRTSHPVPAVVLRNPRELLALGDRRRFQR